MFTNIFPDYLNDSYFSNENINCFSDDNNDNIMNLDNLLNENGLYSPEYREGYDNDNNEPNAENHDLKEDVPPLNIDNKPSDISNDRANADKQPNVTITQTKTTNDKTICPNIIPLKKEKIFDIDKKPHLGRKRKDKFYNIKSITHTKEGKDNILIKIKRRVYNYSLVLINSLLNITDNPKLKGKRLVKNENSLISSYNKEKNMELLDLKLKDIFSKNISKKFKFLDKDYNKDLISFILRGNDKDLNLILKKTFREMIELYCNDNVEDNIFKYFNRLKDDLKEFKIKGETGEYIKIYEEKAKRFEENILKIDERPKRRNHQLEILKYLN